MIPNDFIHCFDNFFRLGTESFFKPFPVGGFSVNNNFSSIQNRSSSRQTYGDLGVRRNNETPVVINSRRLQWYDSNVQRALVPLPSGSVRSIQLTKQELDKIQTEIFDETKLNDYEITDCDICLGIFKNGSKIKVLPCKHAYHSECIERWLTQRPLCPRCRAGVRSGLRRQSTNDMCTKIKAKNNNFLLAQSIEKRRKLFNEYYLKKRKKRLDKTNNTEKNLEADSSSKFNSVKMTDSDRKPPEDLEAGHDAPSCSVDDQKLHQQENSNSARQRAVEAAIKRLAVSKQENLNKLTD